MAGVKSVKRDKQPIREEEVCVCFNLRKAARIVTHIYDEAIRPLGFRATQVTLLGVISHKPPMTVKELAGFIDSDPTTLLRNLRVLEREKLILLTKGEDRRERRVELTQKGNALLAKAYPVWKQTQDRIASRVGRNHLNQLLDDLNRALISLHPK